MVLPGNQTARIMARSGNQTARIVATIVGLLESFFYGLGGLVAVALCLTSLIMLYLPRSNAYFRPHNRTQPPPERYWYR